MNLINQGPHTVTILPTYRCTAECKECCFESNPRIKTKLNYADIIRAIDEAIEAFPLLDLIVFSGGECFTLKDSLYKAIKYASVNGLKTRCVTNGYWAKSKDKAEEIVSILLNSGLSEINFSTGLDHQEYVSEQTIINAANACCEAELTTLIMVEKDTYDSNCRQNLFNDSGITKHVKSGILTIKSNTWMPFQRDYQDRGFQIDKDDIRKGCDQVFENLVITPHGRISSCCGLTFEHIPEMKIGSIHEKGGLKLAYDRQLNDFLKIWIKVDGPLTIIEKLMGEDYIDNQIGSVSHNCQACVYLHKKEDILDKLKESYKEYIPDVMLRIKTQNFINNTVET